MSGKRAASGLLPDVSWIFSREYQTMPAIATRTPISFSSGISSPKKRQPPVNMITVCTEQRGTQVGKGGERGHTWAGRQPPLRLAEAETAVLQPWRTFTWPITLYVREEVAPMTRNVLSETSSPRTALRKMAARADPL